MCEPGSYHPPEMLRVIAFKKTGSLGFRVVNLCSICAIGCAAKGGAGLGPATKIPLSYRPLGCIQLQEAVKCDSLEMPIAMQKFCGKMTSEV